MNKYYYIKTLDRPLKKRLGILSLGIFFLGSGIVLYVFSPLILWQIYFGPLFASQNITTPIPKDNIVNKEIVSSLLEQAKNSIKANYSNANNWFPVFKPSRLKKPKVSSYTLSIPKIRIRNASVSANDTDLGKHLVNYPGTSIPGDFGNAVIFGHSTLPQLYNPKDYKTILANAYKLEIGDKIYATLKKKTYSYRIYNITVVDPSDTSVFSQDYDRSYLTLVTCTPPGTIWKRLIVKARIEKT